jgi:hypothetical protein
VALIKLSGEGNRFQTERMETILEGGWPINFKKS